jgi:hypothetical protein
MSTAQQNNDETRRPIVDNFKLDFSQKPSIRLFQRNMILQLVHLGRNFKDAPVFKGDNLETAKKTFNIWNAFYVRYYYRYHFMKYTKEDIDPIKQQIYQPDKYLLSLELNETDTLMDPIRERRLSMDFCVKFMELYPLIGVIPQKDDFFQLNHNIVKFLEELPQKYLDETIKLDVEKKWMEFISKVIYSWNERECDILDQFKMSHFYMIMQAMLNLNYLYIPKIERFEREVPKTKLKDIVNVQMNDLYTRTPKIKDKIHLGILNLASFPLFRDLYIVSKTSTSVKSYPLNVLKVTVNTKMIPMHTLHDYQNKLSKYLIQIGRELDWDLTLYLSKEFPELEQPFYLEVIDSLFNEKCYFKYWLFRNVVPLEAYLRYPEIVNICSTKRPLIVQLQWGGKFHILHNAKPKYNEDFFIMMEIYFELLKSSEGMQKIKSIAKEEPWLYVWRKNIKTYIDLKAISESFCKNFDAILEYVPTQEEISVTYKDTEEYKKQREEYIKSLKDPNYVKNRF